MAPVVVIVSDPPATGKTTIAKMIPDLMRTAEGSRITS